MVSSPFYRQSPAIVAGQQTRAAVADGRAASSAMRKFLDELALDAGATKCGGDKQVLGSFSPRMEHLLDAGLAALETLRSRTKQHLRFVEKAAEHELVLAVKVDKARRDVAEVDEEIVRVKLTDVALRSELDGLRRSIARAKTELGAEVER